MLSRQHLYNRGDYLYRRALSLAMPDRRLTTYQLIIYSLDLVRVRLIKYGQFGQLGHDQYYLPAYLGDKTGVPYPYSQKVRSNW